MLEIAIPSQVAGAASIALRVRGDIPPWEMGGMSQLTVGAGPSGTAYAQAGSAGKPPTILFNGLGVPTTAISDLPGMIDYYWVDGGGNRVSPLQGFDFVTPTFTVPAGGSLYLYNVGIGGTSPCMVIRGLWWVIDEQPFANLVSGKRHARAHFNG